MLPEVGSVIRGETIATMSEAEAVELKYRPTAVYTPSGMQLVGAIGLVLAGGLASIMLGRFGREADSDRLGDDPIAPS